jgi:hypothetical protein
MIVLYSNNPLRSGAGHKKVFDVASTPISRDAVVMAGTPARHATRAPAFRAAAAAHTWGPPLRT